MKQLEMSKWLKGITLFTGFIGMLVLTVILPFVVDDYTSGDGLYGKVISIFIWITAIPVYISLYKVWGICHNISRNNSFCHQNAKLLKDISGLAILDTILYLCSLAIFRHDAVLILLMVCAMAGGIFIAVLTVALAHLTTRAADLKDEALRLKQENDLTI